MEINTISPVDSQPVDDPLIAVQTSLKNPLNLQKISDYRGAKSAVIAVNDKTRPVPHQFILPPLLEELKNIGIPSKNITILIATGTHKPMGSDEISRLLPEDIIRTYSVISHDCDYQNNLSYLGETSRGTPVWINSIIWNSDLRIVTGNIEPHHFMGFSGGAKSLSIGCAGRITINKNHEMLINPAATIGAYESNPMRQDVEEIAQMAGLQYALNVVLNNKKEISNVFAGSPLDVMQAGIDEVQNSGLISIPAPYDLAIASVGGFPKDINLYQSQKAITHAALCVRDGGAVILAAECREGSGSPSFEEFVKGTKTLSDVFERFNNQGFRIGPHKAFQIARLASRVKIFMVSNIPDEQVKNWFITPAATLNQAFHLASQTVNPLKRVVIMPRATNTIPFLEEN
ncbi:MAG: nickel-dependent lactate racemase [Anaerolineae bacterium]|nr:nickel-dependent lactate racemase [Anaerolineae bacterium]